MNDDSQIKIRGGLPDVHRRRAAEILYDAFRRKQGVLLGPEAQGVAVLEHDLVAASFLAALQDDELVGLAGIAIGWGRYVHPRFSTFREVYGWLRGSLRLLLSAIAFLELPRRGELHIGALAVDASRRGQGIGTRLLEAIFDLARQEGVRAIRLEVVGTNEGARRLYERMGFVVVKTRRYPFIHQMVGFSTVTTMLKELD